MSESSKPLKSWFSAYELADFGRALVGGLPKTVPGCTGRAKLDNYETRVVSGKGGKGGLKTEYKPTERVLNEIHAYLSKGEDAFFEYESNTDLPNRKVKHPEIGYETSSDPMSDPIFIDHYVNVRGGAGPGQTVEDETHDEAIVKVRMDGQILRERVGSNFSALKLANVKGDSMEPTLSHGDQVLVDTSCNRFIDDAIYAILQGDYLRFKRIKLKLDGSIIVKSDNPVDNDPETYTAEEAAEFIVKGRVIPYKFGKFKI